MKKFRELDIKGTLLDKNQFEKYIEHIAQEHVVTNKSCLDTYPIKKLRDDYAFILETYNLLVKHLKLGIKIHSAGEWILDNFYIIEETEKILEKELNKKIYKNLAGISSNKYYGFPRIYLLAEEMVAFSDSKIDKEMIDLTFRSYNKKKFLNMNEMIYLGTFLKISLISKIRDLCEKIYISQLEKMKVESLLNRVVDNNENSELELLKKKYVKYKISDENYKYSFIEYLSYRLKKYDKDAIKYQEILEKEVLKLGMMLQDVIQKEHLYIANLKITMGNCITSIKNLTRIDFNEFYGYLNLTEELLNKDPALVFPKMDEESKAQYRLKIEEKSRKSKISEIYIAEKILELAEKEMFNNRKKHVGYYLFKEDGIEKLDKELEIKHRKKLSNKQLSKLYISYNILSSMLYTFYIYVFFRVNAINNLLSIISSLILFIPVSEINIRLINYILLKLVKPKKILKLNFEEYIPEEAKTIVVVPTILNSIEKVREIFDKLEVYYLANKYENIYFTLLGDTTEEKTEKVEQDSQIIDYALEYIDKLNNKYNDNFIPKFSFIYRKRVWNSSEKSYLGWERKRGLLYEFTKYLRGYKDNTFIINTLDSYMEKLVELKYVITLDSDTNLILNSAPKLIGAMEHILNKPIIQNKKVIDGFGIMQPKIGLELQSSYKSKFVELYSIKGGIDFYSSASFDIYQDCFDEGIYTGKGIYNIDVYINVLENEIPECTVLSHDLLEGNYLRCALVNDVELLDGFPSNYLSYILRNHRWIRGDWQIIRWLFLSKFDSLSKFKIYDNLRRSLISPIAFIELILGFVFYKYNTILFYFLIIFSFVCINISHVLNLLNYIIFKESNYKTDLYGYKNFSHEYSDIKINLLRMILNISFLPYETFKNIDAIIRSIYRMKNKTKLLEWTTSEDGDKKFDVKVLNFYSKMSINIIFSIIVLFFNNIISLICSVLWILAPFIAYILSKELSFDYKIDVKEKDYLLKIGKRTWKYFEKYITKENNYLIPDNYQEDRKVKIVYRTSSTNIGLELLSVISANDLGYISVKEALEYIKNILDTVLCLSKWNGHLYNWYDIKTLLPLRPMYISTVDSGNFVGYLYIVKEYLESNKNKSDYDYLIDIIDNLIKETDFSKLYSKKSKLFSIGFNLEENKLTDSYYDFLASEARQTSLVAIAKKDVSPKHWNNLSRTTTIMNGYKGLVSWTGTAFEYLMPNINFKRYEGSLLDESCKFAIMSQIEYAKKLKIPWGISESAFNLRDLNNNYQYKAFGIPWLGLKRGLEDDIVVSPYSTFLSLEDVPKEAYKNIKRLEDEEALSEFGFYDSIDYTPQRIGKNKKVIVKNYMAHHQGLILLSINNFLNKNILKRRFSNNPEIEAVNVLLEERMPVQMIITKKKKEKIIRNKNIGPEVYVQRLIDKRDVRFKNVNVLANDEYQIIMNDYGESVSFYKDVMVNSYKKTSELFQGINFYIRSLNNKYIFKLDNYKRVIFSPDKSEYFIEENNLKIEKTIFLDPNKALEIRRIKITNLSNKDELLDIISDFEPSLSMKMQEYSHPAFNKMFFRFDMIKDNLVVRKIDRQSDSSYYLIATLYTESEQIGNFNYEIDKENYLGRENLENKTIFRFSNSIYQTLNPIIAMKKTIKVKAKDVAYINLILSVGLDKDQVLNNLEQAKSEEEIIRSLKIAKVRSEEEGRYLRINGKEIDNYMTFLKYIVNPNYLKVSSLNKTASINSLWKYSISGDNPILLIKVRNIEDIYFLEEIIKAYEYFRIKKIKIDLVIINYELNLYDRYVSELIDSVILNNQLNHLLKIDGGIFVFNKDEINEEDLSIIEYKSNLVVNYNNGSLDYLIKELKKNEDELRIKRDINKEKKDIIDQPIKKEEFKNLKYDNCYGGFNEDKGEYQIVVNKENKLPSVWCNILCNKFFGTLVTTNMGGYIWGRNSRLERITSWNNDKVNDLPSEMYYMKDMDTKEYWTLNSGVRPNDNNYYINYGFGYSIFKNINDNIKQTTTMFVSSNKTMKFIRFEFENISDEIKNLKFLIYLKLVLGEDEILTNGNIKIIKQGNYFKIKNMFSESNEEKNIYVLSSRDINFYTNEKEDFFGEGSVIEPDSLYYNLNNKLILEKTNSLGIEYIIRLGKQEKLDFSLIIMKEDSFRELEKTNNLYLDNNYINIELKKTKNFWNNMLNNITVKTPSESINILMNGYLIYQTLTSRIYSKTGYFQSGGAYGFRDQLQDTLALKFLDSNYLKDQIINCASHQFIEGDVLHWWHVEIKKGIRTRISDDALWLVYATIEYIEFVNSYDILDEKISYLKGEILKEDEEEKYSNYYESKIKESLFEHLIRAIDNTLNKNFKCFPKIGTGDWNDGFNKVGNKGEGESIWLGFFLYSILKKFQDICKVKQRDDLKDKYNLICEKLKRNLNTKGWDGRWFKRAITDNGEIIGSITSDECRIDSIAQSWSIISDAADNDKKFIAMEEAENYLVDRENKLIKLFDPPFENSNINPGYIKSYPPGIRENGGQYTHAACWFIIAEAILGFGDKAVEFAEMINPIEHSKTKEEAKRFKLEPYIMEADIYTNKDLQATGGWNWYTGSSSWYYKTILEYILGLKIKDGKLQINPCISKNWKEFEINFKYKTSIYNIKVKNINRKNTGISSFIVNGQNIESQEILLEDNCKINNLEIFM